MDPTTTGQAPDFEEDPRYAIANREALWAVGYWVVYTVVVTGSACLLGYGIPGDELGFVLGFPTWFFWSVLVSSVVFSIIPALIIRRWFTEMSLEAYGEAPPARSTGPATADPTTGGR